MTLDGTTAGQESLKEIHLRLPASLHDDLKLIADKQHVPLSNLLRMIIRGWVYERKAA